MRARITEAFVSPETKKTYPVGAVVDGREARFAVNAGKAVRYNYKERNKDAHRLILSGALIGMKEK